jgi:hypothetical protein
MHRMERKLAYEHCVAVLNAYCRMAFAKDELTFLNLAGSGDEAVGEIVTEAIGYLEWRGLLERDAKDPRLAAILDEDKIEATR